MPASGEAAVQLAATIEHTQTALVAVGRIVVERVPGTSAMGPTELERTHLAFSYLMQARALLDFGGRVPAATIPIPSSSTRT